MFFSLVYERNVRERTDFLCRIPAFNSTNLPRLRDLCMYLQYNRFHVGKEIAKQGNNDNQYHLSNNSSNYSNRSRR